MGNISEIGYKAPVFTLNNDRRAAFVLSGVRRYFYGCNAFFITVGIDRFFIFGNAVNSVLFASCNAHGRYVEILYALTEINRFKITFLIDINYEIDTAVILLYYVLLSIVIYHNFSTLIPSEISVS